MNTLKGTLFLVGLFAAMLVIGWLIKRMEDKHREEEKTRLLVKWVESGDFFNFFKNQNRSQNEQQPAYNSADEVMGLIIILAGPAIIGTGLYVGDRFMFWFGVFYTALFVVAYFVRRYNERRIAKERAELIERFYEAQTASDKQDDIAR